VAGSLETIEIETRSAPRATVIWMHGLGADGHDFVPVVPELALPAALPVRFVFPHAPMRRVTLNRGAVMRAWYDIREDRGTLTADAADVAESQRLIATLLAHEARRGIAAGRIVLAGFSQGGAMALHCGIRHPERLGGVIALSCSLPVSGTVAAEASGANRDLPIIMAHGVRDPLIPLARARRSRNLLLELGYRIEWHEYPIPHSVGAEEIRDIGAWLRGTLSAGE
jgi:phospholipase/carboxylesterase